MFEWIGNHQVLSTFVGYYLFSSFVGALPTPDETSGKAYRFFYSFAPMLAANLMRIPQVRNLINGGEAKP